MLGCTKNLVLCIRVEGARNRHQHLDKRFTHEIGEERQLA